MTTPSLMANKEPNDYMIHVIRINVYTCHTYLDSLGGPRFLVGICILHRYSNVLSSHVRNLRGEGEGEGRQLVG